MATIGNVSPGTTVQGFSSTFANKQVMGYDMPVSDFLWENGRAYAYLGGDTDDCPVKFVVYNYPAQVAGPQYLVAVSDEITVLATDAMAWREFTFPQSFVLFPDIKYAIGIIVGGAGIIHIGSRSSFQPKFSETDDYTDGPSDPWSTYSYVSTAEYSWYMNLAWADVASTKLKLAPSASDVIEPTTVSDFRDAGTKYLDLAPSQGQGRLFFGPDSYLTIPFPTSRTNDIYLEMELDWSPTDWDAWGSFTSGLFLTFYDQFTGGTPDYLYIIKNSTPTATWRTIGNQFPIAGDGRGKHTIKIWLKDGLMHHKIDDARDYVFNWYSVGGRVFMGATIGFKGLSSTVIPQGGVYVDSWKLGTTDGASDLGSSEYTETYTQTGTIIAVPADPPNTDALTVKFALTPKFETPVTTRALCEPEDQDVDLSCLEYTLPTPVGMGDGPVYGTVEFSWLYGQSYIGYGAPIIQLLDDTDSEVDILYINPDDLSVEYWSDANYPELYTDVETRWPGPDKGIIKFRYEDGQIDWVIKDHSTGPKDTYGSNVAKVQFGWTQVVYDDPQAGIFIDEVGVGLTPAYELAKANFEDGTPGDFDEVGTPPAYLENIGPGLLSYSPYDTEGSDGSWIWYGPFGRTNGPIYIECDVTWTLEQQTAWGNYSAYFIFLHDHELNWVQGIYHDTDGWWDFGDLDLPAPPDDSGTHHIKMVYEDGVATITIDENDPVISDVGGGTIDSVKFGQVYGAYDIGACTISNIKVGTTDGGTEHLAR